MMSFACLILAFASLASVAAAAAPVDITISGTQPVGKVRGQVYGDAASFKARDKPVLSFVIEPSGSGSVKTSITLPPGRYAIALFQDVKGTGKLETGFLGKPLVPYGFSNNAQGSFGPPGFDAAAFEVFPAATHVAIQLR